MKPEHENYLKIQEEVFIDSIIKTLEGNKGKTLGKLEHSPLDMIHAYVKELTMIHRATHIMQTLETIPLN